MRMRAKVKNKRRRRVFGFNMVEVALAMLVISLGLSTVLVLFPTGLKASHQAEEELNLADAVDAMETYIRLKADKLGGTEAKVLTHDSTDGITDGGADVVESSFSPSTNANKYKAILQQGNAYLYRKLVEMNGEVITEFSCVVRLLQADVGKGIAAAHSGSNVIGYFLKYGGDRVNLTASSQTGAASADDSQLAYFKVIDMEVSYPADLPYAERKKRVYRLEIFDGNYAARE